MVRWFEKRLIQLRQQILVYAEDIFYIILFVTAGASLHTSMKWSKRDGSQFYSRLFVVRQNILCWQGRQELWTITSNRHRPQECCFMPMAGLAIGLLQNHKFIDAPYRCPSGYFDFCGCCCVGNHWPSDCKICFPLVRQKWTEGQ